MELLIGVGVAAVAFVMVLVGILIVLAKFRIVPEADQAVVITGTTKKTEDKATGETRQRPKVVVGGGAYVIPIWNKHKIVPLEVVQIPISWKEGGLSVSATLPSKDRIPVELEGELSVHVDGENEDQIILASQKLGIPNQQGLLNRDGSKKFNMREAVKQKADKLVQAALRTAVFEFTFVDLNAKKEDFEERVQTLLQKDLARFGLTLTAVSIPHVSQGDFGDSEGDMFDEEGKRRVAEIVEDAKTQTNDIEQTNKIARQKRDLAARENELTLDYEKAQKEADQSRQVAEYEAQQTAATRKEVLDQEQAVKEAEASQERAVKQAQIDEARKVEEAEIAKAKQIAITDAKAEAEKAAADAEKREAEEDAKRREEEAKVAQEKAVETKTIEKNKAIEEARIEKEKAVKVADEKRQQAVEEAEVERQKAVAEVKAEEAEARATQADAEALQKKAEESIVTVKETAEADRQKQVVVIKAEEDAKRETIDADKAAYVAAKNAEGERDAKMNLAQAEKAEAQGHADAKRAEAEGSADAIKIAADGYATDIKTRADADFEAADKQAEAKIKLAAAALEEGKSTAESRRLQVEAENALDNRLIFQAIALAGIQQAPSVVRELMAPVANVAHDVKILQVSGMGDGDGSGVEGLPQTILQTGLAAAGVAPFLKDAISAAKDNPEVQETASMLGGIAKGVLKEAATGIREGLSDQSNGGGAAITAPVEDA